ncbi:MAG: glycyl-radical enzyme activating protein [Clostridia bacterium]|nr:glycyl-radical enzyme activating protein [Clostridia bacterium]
MDGKIFDIQRFSIYDGEGIRTNVFFKGCNLRCLWCHNPESQSMKNELMFYKDKCRGCGECVKICGSTFTDSCIACGKCVDVCSFAARKISGQTVTADEVVEKVLRDKAFYDTSGGGVTLSGGEPLLQPDFALEILKKCKENGVNTAMETAADVPWQVFEKVLPYLDFVFCDLKCIDGELHKRLTGVCNTRILENAGRLKTSGVKMRFRMPVVPGLNDGEAEKAARFAGETPIELMAYHVTGCGKYAALGREYTISEIEPPTKEFMAALAEKTGAIYDATGIN